MRFQCQSCKSILDIETCESGGLVTCGQCGGIVNVPATRTSPGAVLGDFVIIKALGNGGMGTVFLAHQISLDRDVALKVLLPEYASDKNFVKDFINEARMAASLNHPNVVQAYAINTDNGEFYFAMEYVNGSTLKDIMAKNGPLNPQMVINIAIDTVSALSYAWHEKALVHRDIKPDNIMITTKGQTKLADLGLAKKTNANEPSTEGAPTSIFGTPQYVAPETLLGKKSDFSSDIYSLGATLYHLVTGQFPYGGDTVEEIPEKHLFVPLEPIAKVKQGIPANLAAIIEVMLSKRPCQRYASYEELEDDLRRVKAGEMPKRQPEPGSQIPIEIKADDPLAPIMPPNDNESDSTQQNKLKLKIKSDQSQPDPAESSNNVPPVETQAEPSATEVSPQQSQAEQPPAEETEANAKTTPKSKKTLVIGIVAILVVACLITCFCFTHKSETADADAPAVSSADKKALDGLKEMIEANRDEATVVAEIKRLLPILSYPNPLAVDFYSTAAPFMEKELVASRNSELKKIDDKWDRDRKDLLAKIEQKKAEDARKAAEAEKAAKEAEAKRQEQERLKAEAQEYAKEQIIIREKLLEAANKFDFDVAPTILAKYEASSNPKQVAWAKGWLAIHSNADKFYSTFRNSEKKFQGIEINLLGHNQKENWKIDEIKYDKVEVSFLRTVWDKKKGQNVNKVEREELNLKSMLFPQLRKMANALVEKNIATPNEANIMLFSFMVARGSQIEFLKKNMPDNGDFKFALSELNALNSNAYLNAMTEAMRSMKYQDAFNLAFFLMRNDPDAYDIAKDKIAKVLEDLK